MAEELTFADATYQLVPINEVHASGLNPRKIAMGSDDIKELAKTVKQHDLLQPILVRADPDGGYECIAGERRLVAARKAGKANVPVVIREMDNQTAAEMLALENLQRRELDPIEEAEAVAKLLVDGKTEKDVAASLGKTAGWVARRANLVNLCAEWREYYADPDDGVSKWTRSHLDLVARLPVEAQRAYGLKLEKAEDLALWTVDELASDIGRFVHDLKHAPWDLDDGRMPGGGCNDCEKRSDKQGSLWDDMPDRVTCLDTPCYEKCLKKHMKQRLRVLKAEHGDRVLQISADAFRSTVKLASVHDIEWCKEKDKNARPAIVIKGEGVGKEGWARYLKGRDPVPDYVYAADLAALVNESIENLPEKAFGSKHADRAYLAWYVLYAENTPGPKDLKATQEVRDKQLLHSLKSFFQIEAKALKQGVQDIDAKRLKLIGIDLAAMAKEMEAGKA